VLQRGLAARIADLRKGAVVAKLGILWYLIEERKKERLALPQAAGAQMSQRLGAPVCDVGWQRATV
jgi:hypothetical protein